MPNRSTIVKFHHILDDWWQVNNKVNYFNTMVYLNIIAYGTSLKTVVVVPWYSHGIR